MLNLYDCYQVLGVSPHASAQEVRHAYLELVKRWHPDSQFTPSRSAATSVEHFLQIQAAYDFIRQNQPKTEKNPLRPFKRRPSRSSPSVSLSDAEQRYEQAVQFARQGLYRKAIAELSAAIRIDPYYDLAYKYRGCLKAYLGLEQQSKADFIKAQVLQRHNTSWESQKYKSSGSPISDQPTQGDLDFGVRDDQRMTELFLKHQTSLFNIGVILLFSGIFMMLNQIIRDTNLGPVPYQLSPTPINYELHD